VLGKINPPFYQQMELVGNKSQKVQDTEAVEPKKSRARKAITVVSYFYAIIYYYYTMHVIIYYIYYIL
jgi:hypothetical protein